MDTSEAMVEYLFLYENSKVAHYKNGRILSVMPTEEVITTKYDT